MKRIILAVVAATLLAGCGGGGGGGTSDTSAGLVTTTTTTLPPVNSTPVISDLRFSPTSATLNQGGGMITVSSSYYVTDAGADLAGGTVTLTAYDTNNNMLDTLTTPLTNVTGYTATGMSGNTSVVTSIAVTSNFTLYLTDGKGNRSNTLTGTFTVK
jgi:hypothetical protein